MNWENAFYRAGQKTISGLASLLLDMDVAYQAPLPDGPKILAANHPTTTDPVWLMTLAPREMSLLVTEMVFRIPLLGGYMERAGHIRVDEGAGRAAFDRAVAKLRAGKTVGIFPEGALSPREGGMCPARTGTARMALIAAVPVIPVGIWLDRSLIRRQETQVDHMEATARYYLRGPYAMTVGEPLTFTGNVEDREAVRAMSSAINDRIQRLTIESARRLYERRRVEAHDLISAAQGMQI